MTLVELVRWIAYLERHGTAKTLASHDVLLGYVTPALSLRRGAKRRGHRHPAKPASSGRLERVVGPLGTHCLGLARAEAAVVRQTALSCGDPRAMLGRIETKFGSLG